MNMTSNESSTILVIGKDTTLNYLLGRFAEHGGYQLKINSEHLSTHEIAAINPAVIIFLSTEQLARDQSLLTELASLDTPIVVCSSIAEKARAIELGADYCLLHPLTYDDFKTALVNATSSKRG
jgi:ActR/RegA family two-component response regulator